MKAFQIVRGVQHGPGSVYHRALQQVSLADLRLYTLNPKLVSVDSYEPDLADELLRLDRLRDSTRNGIVLAIDSDELAAVSRNIFARNRKPFCRGQVRILLSHYLELRRESVQFCYESLCAF